MENLNNQLGKTMSAKEVAAYLNVDVKTVRKYYDELGGIRLGRHFRFFEKEVCNAIQAKKQMGCPSEIRRSKKTENILYTEGGDRLGIRNTEKAGRGVDREDRHALLA
jgi:excisionase family DNA binding protein